MTDICESTHDSNSNIVDLAPQRGIKSKISTPGPAGRAGWIAAIQSAQFSIETAVGSILTHALAAGDVLIKAKAELKTIGGPRGRWGQFLEDCGLSARTAEVYIQLATGRAVIEAAMANPQRAAELSIRSALKLLPSKKKSSSPPSAYSVAVKAVAKLSEEERTRLIAEFAGANVPVTVKADTKQNTVTPKDHSAEDRLALADDRLAALDRFIKSVRSTEATRASEEHKNTNILAKLKAFIKNDRAPPVCDRIDREVSSFMRKPGITAVSLGSDTTTESQTKH